MSKEPKEVKESKVEESAKVEGPLVKGSPEYLASKKRQADAIAKLIAAGAPKEEIARACSTRF